MEQATKKRFHTKFHGPQGFNRGIRALAVNLNFHNFLSLCLNSADFVVFSKNIICTTSTKIIVGVVICTLLWHLRKHFPLEAKLGPEGPGKVKCLWNWNSCNKKHYKFFLKPCFSDRQWHTWQSNTEFAQIPNFWILTKKNSTFVK